MMNNQVQNWSEAIFQVYKEDNKIKLLEEELIFLIQLFNKNEKFVSILKTSVITVPKKKQIIKETFFKYLSTNLFNSINLMVEKKISVLILPILIQTVRIIDESNNVKHGIIYSVINLDKIQLNNIENKISKKLNKKIKFINKIDKNIIAGLKIVVDNTVFDYTILSRLKDMKKNIVNSNE